VTIRVWQEDENLRFCVQDTGPGIAPEDIPKAFEAFRQIGSESWRRREGAGLGLPISRRFIELHGGKMWIESTPGEGTAFHFVLPLPDAIAHAEPEEITTPIDTQYWHRLEQRAQRERVILVLSSDPVAAEVIARYTEDYRVIAVPSLDQVSAKAAEVLPSAIVVDHTEVKDRDLESLLTNLPYDIPVLSLPFPGSPHRPRHLPAGVSAYLVKPVDRQTLREVIGALETEVRRLLIVDDDPGMVRFVSRSLASVSGESPRTTYELVTAMTGGQALDLLNEVRPDAVLLDLALPDISGWQVLDELHRRQVPTVLVTAHDWPQMVNNYDQEALRIAMQRPLSQQELKPVLKCLLRTVRPTYPAPQAETVRPTGPFA
jgi:DNA-binding response OmpR family regulator